MDYVILVLTWHIQWHLAVGALIIRISHPMLVPHVDLCTQVPG